MAGIKLCITIILFFDITSRHLLCANPLDQRHINNNWSEMVVSKHVFDDKGELIGEPEIQVFINPRKCTFTVGKFIRLPCLNNESQRSEVQQQDLSTSAPWMEINDDSTTILPNKILKTLKYVLPSNPNHIKDIGKDSVINPPRLDCPEGQKIDYFGNCKVIW